MVTVVGVITAGLFLVGTVVHVVDLLQHGLRAYEWAPKRLNLYWPHRRSSTCSQLPF
ncbi:hypothetical protein ACGFSI_26175 [Streptomyces virginiae]|uniref:hypothetical protein n=1 Tax=Streptomyces virginiae TaxID=1961 RepID=UPI00371EB51C